MAVTSIGPYRLGRLLGKGGFASVQLGTHDTTGDKVAVKVMQRNGINTDEQIKMEIALCKRLTHENIVRYVAHYVTAKTVYLAMECVDGGELYDQLEAAGRFDESRAREIFAQIVDGVSYCHSRGVCHRDLKLENVLWSTDGTVRLTDFGFSKDFSQQSPKSTVGTALYVAPEVVLHEGQQYDGELADIWSLGIILYLLAAGRFPFNRGHVGGVAPGMSSRSKEKFGNDNFRVPSHFSMELTALLRKILCANPKHRASIADIRSHPWFTGRTGANEPPVTPPGTPHHAANKEDHGAAEELDWTEIAPNGGIAAPQIVPLSFDSDGEDELWDEDEAMGGFESLAL